MNWPGRHMGRIGFPDADKENCVLAAESANRTA
jgi:hypothetical protein